MSDEEFDSYISKFDKVMGKYIPPESTWTPVDEALYSPKDLRTNFSSRLPICWHLFEERNL